MKELKNYKKKAKSAKVVDKPYLVSRIVFVCPSCKTEHIDCRLSEEILRIRCTNCGQEIILNWSE